MFTRNLRTASVGLLTTLTALAGACERAPTAPAPSSHLAASTLASTGSGVWREVTEDVYDLTGVVASFPCGEASTEEILMEGRLYWRGTILEDGALGLHSVLHTMPIGMRGVGLITGAEYRIAEGEQGVFNQSSMGEVGSYQHTLRLSAPAIGLHARLVIGGRFTFNANGQLVVERPILRVDCRM